MRRIPVMAFALAALLGACAELTAEAPLFSVADQGQPPIAEGIWIGVGDECPERYARARRFPKECAPLDIRRGVDGAWQVSFRVDLVSNLTAQDRRDETESTENGPFRLVLVPGVERAIANDSYAPIYVAEMDRTNDDSPAVSYAVVAPTGPLPASEMRILSIGCASILRDGPIQGITPSYETQMDGNVEVHQTLGGCSASNQDAVREAARRSVVESLPDLVRQRFVWVRAN